jgi:hypothetical protein
LSLTAETIRKVAELSEHGGGRLLERYNSLIEPIANDQRMPEATRRLYGPLQAPLREQRPAVAAPAAPAAPSASPPVAPPLVVPPVAPPAPMSATRQGQSVTVPVIRNPGWGIEEIR